MIGSAGDRRQGPHSSSGSPLLHSNGGMSGSPQRRTTAEAATSPFPKGSPRRLHRVVSSTTLLEALRQLGREHPDELGPLLGRQPRQRARCLLLSAVALVVVACAILLAALRWAVAHEVASRAVAFDNPRAVRLPEPHAPPLRAKPALRAFGAALLGVCGVCLARWPGARLYFQRVVAALLQGFGSAGAASAAQHQHVGRLARPLSHAMRIARALLPSSAVEWLLVAFNLALFTRLWIFTRSGAFVAVCASPHLFGGPACPHSLRFHPTRLCGTTRVHALPGRRFDSDARVTHRVPQAFCGFSRGAYASRWPLRIQARFPRACCARRCARTCIRRSALAQATCTRTQPTAEIMSPWPCHCQLPSA